MIWIVFLLIIAGIVWFLFAPRRLQTLENVPDVVTKRFRVDSRVETTEDPREITPEARVAAKAASDRPVKGHGDSLTRDWPSEENVGHGSAGRQPAQARSQEKGPEFPNGPDD